MSWARQEEARRNIFRMFESVGLNTSARCLLIDHLDALQKATRKIALDDAAKRIGKVVQDQGF